MATEFDAFRDMFDISVTSLDEIFFGLSISRSCAIPMGMNCAVAGQPLCFIALSKSLKSGRPALQSSCTRSSLGGTNGIKP
jgi:hypothetical protein